ncbi:MAG: anti-sigma regulatory factor [Gammaproteobacteria bacterium]
MGAITLVIDSELQNVALMAAAVRGLCAAAALTKVDIDRLELGVVEALNNAIIHAYKDQPGGEIRLLWTQEEDMLRIHISDQGQSMRFPPDGHLPGPEAENGRGWFIIQSCVDQLEYGSERGVNTVTLTKRLHHS